MNKNSISSIKDPLISKARELHSFEGRKKNNQCLIFGEDIIELALQSKAQFSHIFYSENYEKISLLKKFSEKEIPCYSVKNSILSKVTEASHYIPIVAVINLPLSVPSLENSNFAVILDNLQDHGNIGTIIRTSAAFGINTIISTQKTDIFYKRIIEASRTKVFDMNFISCNSDHEVISILKKNNFQIIATSPHGKTLQSMVNLEKKPIALIVGNEAEGVSEHILSYADHVIQIPMHNSIESLNVGVAAGLSIYELKFKQVLVMLTDLIKTSLGREIGVAHTLIREALDYELKKVSDLTSKHLILMMILACDQTMTKAQISKDIALFGNELEEFLKKLSDKSYIQFLNTETIFLTQKGTESLAHLWSTREAVENKILSTFSEKEKEQLKDYIKRIQVNAEKAISS